MRRSAPRRPGSGGLGPAWRGAAGAADWDARRRRQRGIIGSPYIIIRDETCRLFGYQGAFAPDGSFGFDHMFGF